jgi:deoxycytidine triphosphate deaminase
VESPFNEQLKFEDPDASNQGILLSNQIHKLCNEGLLISKDTYEPKNLRPAAYTLTIGDDYIDSDGIERQLSKREQSIVFRKNSIIFVSTKEKLELPHYIIARFNLRVDWVYNGILLGTGPQVDPGFSGKLSCPLYNLTNTDIIIKRGELFATIDFEKTTKLLVDLSLEQKKQLITEARNKHLQPVGEETYTFYRAGPLPALGWRKSHKIVSSLAEMDKEVRTWRNLGIGSVIAFIGLTLSLLAFGANLYRQNSDLARQVAEDKSDVYQMKERISDLEKRIEQLQPLQK